MNVHAEKLIPVEDQRVFEGIRRSLFTLAIHPSTSCHLLARAVGSAYCLSYVDGHFNVLYEHSWLITSHGNIIDVYPIGVIGGPILIDAVNGPWRSLYCVDADWSSKIDLVQLRRLTDLLLERQRAS